MKRAPQEISLTALASPRLTTQPVTEREAHTLRDLMPMYAVILHNDDVNPMDFVVQALLKSVPDLSQEDAVRIMLEAHNEGKAVVIVCPLEPAELYRDRIRSFTLGCTIEKA
jgi:ATP-dependent Clp protease adaptor protein ClpS